MTKSELYSNFINSEQPICNINTTMRTISVNKKNFLISCNDHRTPNNSYVVSPISTYRDYALYETAIIKTTELRVLLIALIKIATLPLRLANIDKINIVNNWLLSTNIYEKISATEIKEITTQLLNNYPTVPIMFRSINSFCNSQLYSMLLSQKYIPIPTRQVYIFDGRKGFSSDFLTHSNTKKTLKLLNTTKFKTATVTHLSKTDWLRIENLYDQLYIKKYYHLNPKFSAAWLEYMNDTKMIEFKLVYDEQKIIAVSGIYQLENIMSTPIVGYDFTYPKKAALNRILMAIELLHCCKSRVIYNASSGASHFKRIRGGIPAIEYSMVYIAHLSIYKKLAWHLLATVTKKIGVPIMKFFKL